MDEANQVINAADAAEVGAGSADAQAVEERLPVEVESEATTVAHVAGVTGGKIRHGAYLVLSGNALDGRTRLARALKASRAELARDMGFDSFEGMPAVRRGVADQFVRLRLAADLMWASFLTTGRLPDRWLDYARALLKYAAQLGLERRLKDARPVNVAELLAQPVNGREGARR